jgi:hypothetical protein
VKTADVLFSCYEPPAFGFFAMLEAKHHGVVKNFFPMPQDPDLVIKSLRESKADAIILISPVYFADFFALKAKELLSIGKPIIELVCERTWNNPTIQFHKNWQENRVFNPDYYFCILETDRKKMIEMGRKAYPLKLFVSKNAFPKGKQLTERVQKFCFIGAVNQDLPGLYAERRRVLQALLNKNLIDIIQVPKGVTSNHVVSYAYASYGGIFCAPCNGNAQSIRLYEGALAGSFLFEVQNVLEANRIFFNNEHCLSFEEGIDEGELCDRIASIKFPEFQEMADKARDVVLENHLPQDIISKILETALSGRVDVEL